MKIEIISKEGNILRRAILFFLLSIILTFSGCSKQDKNVNDPNAFKIIGGSELHDLKSSGLFEYIEKKSGVKINFTESGTLAAIENLTKTDANPTKYDAIWILNGFYLETFKDQIKQKPITSERIFMSPVVFGIKHNIAEKYGWVNDKGFANENITWNDIYERVMNDNLKFYMTNINSSNSGAQGVLGIMNGILGKADPLTIDDLKNPELINKTKALFENGIKKTAGSSGWLADIFLKDGGDAIINYESVIAELNKKGANLLIVYPKDGISIADYPFYLLNEAKKSDYNKIINVLKSEEFQRKAMELTNRRPMNSSIPLKLSNGIDQNRTLYSLSLPNSKEVLNDIIDLYLNVVKKTSQIIFVLDMSGSMEGKNIDMLRQSILNLTGEDNSLTGKLTKFGMRDKVEFILFNDRVVLKKTFTVNSDQDLKDMQEFAKNNLKAGGSTAIYDALNQALKDVDKNKNIYSTIVLLTDGENNRGIELKDFKNIYNAYKSSEKNIPIYPIIFGSSNKSEMDTLGEISGGRTFDAVRQPLESVFKEIRGYN